MTLGKSQKARDARLRREYNITLEERTKVSKYQHDCCAVCKRPEKDMKISLSVDHDHHSGKLRGLLCLRCNKALEILRNDIESFEAAIKYLTNPPFTVILGKDRITAPGRVGTKKRRKLLAKMKNKETNGKEQEKQKSKSNKGV